jgi:hypothetical protein
MFDHIQRGSDRIAAKTWTVAISVFVHVAGAITFIGLSFWKIDKLAMKQEQVVWRPEPDFGPRTPKGDPNPAKPKEQKPKKDVDPSQLEQPKDAATTTEGEASTDSSKDKAATRLGRPDGEADAPDVDVLPPKRDCIECVDDSVVITTAPKEEVTHEPKDVPQEAMRGLRTAGGDILLPGHMLSRLRAAGVGRLRMVLKVCVDEHGGAPSSVTVLESSGFDDADAYVAAGMLREWRYQPFTVNREPMAVCFSVRADYQIID